MGKLKIVHIWKNFDTYNGMVEILLSLAKYYDHSRFEIITYIYSDNNSEYSKLFESFGGKLYSMQCAEGIQGHLSFYKRLKQKLLEHRPDVVVTHDRRCNVFGILAAKSVKVPVIISMETTLKDSGTSKLKRLRDRLFHPLFLFIVWKSNAMVTTSACIRRQWVRRSDPGKFLVVYPPFNLDKYEQAMRETGSAATREGDAPVIGFIGRLSEEKGLQYLIRALPKIRSRFPKVRILAAGIGEMEDGFRKLAVELGVEPFVEFLGFQKNPFHLLRNVDLLAVPSRTDGGPIAVIEALAAGVPVVGSDVGGIPELITEEVGVLVPPQNVSELADAIIGLLGQPEKLKKMGLAAKERAFQTFPPTAFVKKMEELYVNMVQ